MSIVGTVDVKKSVAYKQKEENNMEHRIDNETLNKAIYTVITTKYKKDAQEAHRLVESEGYVIYKDNGKFVVRNDKTCKTISGGIHPMWQYYIISIKEAGYPTRVTRDFKHYAHTDKMNLVSYLDTPHANQVCDGRKV